MIIEQKVNDFNKLLFEIEAARGRNAYSVYTCGNCGNHHLLLKEVVPKAESFSTYPGHIISLLPDQKFYDISGKREDVSRHPSRVVAVTKEELKYFTSNYEMFRNNAFVDAVQEIDNEYFRKDLEVVRKFAKMQKTYFLPTTLKSLANIFQKS